MKKKMENPNEEKKQTPTVTTRTLRFPGGNNFQQIKNMEEEIITENGKTLISEKRALEIALSVVPDLEDRDFSISLEKPPGAHILGGIPEDCWCITYSPFTISSGSGGNIPSNEIFIDKYSGKIVLETKILRYTSGNNFQQIKNMEEEIITENGKTLISEKRALEIALSVVPDLEDRDFSISLEKPPGAHILGGIPEDCWCITYSPFTISSGSGGNISSDGIFIDKFSGKIVFHDGLRDEG